MPSQTPNQNGNDPVNNTRDVEMNDDSLSAKKGGKGKNISQGENMTVVVPPSNGGKPSVLTADGDIEMDEAAAKIKEVVDPVAQTIACEYLRAETWNRMLLIFGANSD